MGKKLYVVLMRFFKLINFYSLFEFYLQIGAVNMESIK